MKADYLTKIMDKVDAFPSIPGSAVRLLELVDQADAPIQEIEEVLRLDPGLTANVLKLTNSAFFGLPAKAGSVKRAVMLLGMNKLKQLIMASCVNAVMDKDIPGYDLPAGELWRHSIAVSVAAEGLVRELSLESGDDIFTAALLHDVGKLVLGQFINEDYAALEAAAGSSVSFEIAEKQAHRMRATSRSGDVLHACPRTRSGASIESSPHRLARRASVDRLESVRRESPGTASCAARPQGPS